MELTVGTAKDASVPTPSMLNAKAASLPATVVTAPSANSCALAVITVIARAGSSSSNRALLEAHMLLRVSVARITYASLAAFAPGIPSWSWSAPHRPTAPPSDRCRESRSVRQLRVCAACCAAVWPQQPPQHAVEDPSNEPLVHHTVMRGWLQHTCTPSCPCRLQHSPNRRLGGPRPPLFD